jgi:L-iditol 2-dehydrogenase
MKVLRLHGIDDLRLNEEPKPKPGPGEVLLRVTAVGICGSDLEWLSEGGIGDAHLDRPLVLGHEFAGVIESGPRRGERVAVDPASNCNACEWCLTGHPNLCSNLRFAGHSSSDGALQEYMSWPEHLLYPLPRSLSGSDGAVLEILGVAIHAVDLGHLKTGMSVGVFGCGPIGLLTVQVAKASGATQIIATDVLMHRLDAARSYGATAVIQARDGEERFEVLEATQGRGVDVAFEAAGENSAVETAITAARLGGRVVLIGIPSDDRTTFTASTARRKGLTIALVRRMKHTYRRAIDMAVSGLVDIRTLVTHRYPLVDFETAFSVAKERKGLKVLIEL